MTDRLLTLEREVASMTVQNEALMACIERLGDTVGKAGQAIAMQQSLIEEIIKRIAEQ